MCTVILGDRYCTCNTPAADRPISKKFIVVSQLSGIHLLLLRIASRDLCTSGHLSALWLSGIHSISIQIRVPVPFNLRSWKRARRMRISKDFSYRLEGIYFVICLFIILASCYIFIVTLTTHDAYYNLQGYNYTFNEEGISFPSFQ